LFEQNVTQIIIYIYSIYYCNFSAQFLRFWFLKNV